MLWALGQPAAAAGLAGGFLLALGLRVVAQRGSILLISARGREPRVLPSAGTDVDPIGMIAAILTGTGWGKGVRRPEVPRRRIGVAVLAGPVAVIAASQLALYGFAWAYPRDLGVLTLNRPSDILHGVVARTVAAQLVLSVAVALLCFGLLALLPIPPLDGFRLARLALTDSPVLPAPAADRLGGFFLLLLAAVPIAGGLSPLMLVLDAVATPLLRVWT